MNLKDTLENAQQIVDSLSYKQAAASGGIGGFLYEFILARGGDLLFVFLAGVVGALGGAFVKLITTFINSKLKKNERTDN